MGYRIEIDTEECMSSGKCVADFGNAFGFDEDELAHALSGVNNLSDNEMLRAARNCPSRAIALFEADGTQVPT